MHQAKQINVFGALPVKDQPVAKGLGDRPHAQASQAWKCRIPHEIADTMWVFTGPMTLEDLGAGTFTLQCPIVELVYYG